VRGLNRLVKYGSKYISFEPEGNHTEGTRTSWSSWGKSCMKYVSWEQYRAQLHERREVAAQVWLDMNRNRRMSIWYALMAWACTKAPREALVPLDVAIHYPAIQPPQRVLDDCLAALATHLLKFAYPPRVQDVDAIYQLACDYAEAASRTQTCRPLRQFIIYQILDYCSTEQRRSLFRTFLTYNMPLSSQTLLQFAEKFTDEGEALIGLEILRSAVNAGAEMSSYAVQSSCVKILRTRPEAGDWIRMQSDLLSQILQMGIKPNTILWTCIMQNAIDAGDYEEAWRWYDMGVADGLKPSQITFSVLLQMAKRGHAKDSLDRITEEAAKEGVLPNDLWLIFDVLHAIYLSERSKLVLGPERTFDAMLLFYGQCCDLGPLRNMGLRLEAHLIDIERGHDLPMPSSRVVGLMLLGYLSQFGKHGDPSVLVPLYSRYRDLVEANDPIIGPLGSTDYVSNAFVKAFGMRSDGLSHCTLVVKNMLTRTTPVLLASELSRNVNPDQTGKPTVQTWNILLSSYIRHRRTEAAEKIVSMMQTRDIKPDACTWNNVIAGYVKTQDVENVVFASRKMRDTGVEYNEFTIQALRRLVDKTRYLKAMEREPSTEEKPGISNSSDAVGQEDVEVVDPKTMARSDTEMSDERGSSLAIKNSSSMRLGANANWQEHEMAQNDTRTNQIKASPMSPLEYSWTSDDPNPTLVLPERLRCSSLYDSLPTTEDPGAALELSAKLGTPSTSNRSIHPREERAGTSSETTSAAMVAKGAPKAIAPQTKPRKQSTRPTFRRLDVPILVHHPNGPGWTPKERRLRKAQERQALRESRAQRKARRLGVDDACGDAVEWVNGAGWYEWKAESEHQEGDWFNYVKA
jgi:pentatricopeptide repeat protein